jgi:ketosteroid isomerase-like protein
MRKSYYTAFHALDPSSLWSWKDSRSLWPASTIFDTLADVFEFLYEFPGWPRATRGRDNLIALYSGYGNNIRLDRGDLLVVHPSENARVVTLEYEVHGKLRATGTPYDNRLVSIATIEDRKIVRWRDYMDSLAAWTALNKPA